MAVINFLLGLFKALGVWPPEDGADPTPWRRSTFVLIWGTIATLAIHIAGVRGYLEFMGVKRTATVADVETIDSRTKSILYAIYAPQVRGLVRERCDTTDRRERERINSVLDRVLRDYKEASGADFAPMPSCQEV